MNDISAEVVEESPPPVWCVAANVLAVRTFGPGGAEKRSGTKQFAPGAKVYVFDFFWGMGGDDVTVIGHQRRTKRYITLVMRAAHLANWRTELVYSPHAIKQILEYGEFSSYAPGSLESKVRAEKIAESYRQDGAATQSFNSRAKIETDGPENSRKA
jgi:hypothetical protein